MDKQQLLLWLEAIKLRIRKSYYSQQLFRLPCKFLRKPSFIGV